MLPNNQQQYFLMKFDQVFGVLQQSPIACLRTKQTGFIETNIPPMAIDGLPTLRPVSAGNLVRAQLENGAPKFPLSLLGCLDRLVRRQNRELNYEIKPLPLQTIFGPMEALIVKLKST
jgi:hypothetical protein